MKKISQELISLAAQVRQVSSLTVLILGPSPLAADLYQKRLEIRDALLELGHDAVFCEDVWKPETLAASGLNISVAEFLTAMSCDYVVCLMTSPGSIGEAYEFASDLNIARKMMICADISHRESCPFRLPSGTE